MNEMYEPSEDSYFLNKILKREIFNFLKKKPNLKLLEIGSGSGINLITALDLGVKKSNIFSCDINADAVKKKKKKGFNCVKSNLFEKIKNKYDLIFFNPPYLPKCKYDNAPDTTGGKKGSEIINKFLIQAKKHLTKNGKIILLTSSLTKNTNWRNYNKKLLAKKNLFFEKLFIWELKIKHNKILKRFFQFLF